MHRNCCTLQQHPPDHHGQGFGGVTSHQDITRLAAYALSEARRTELGTFVTQITRIGDGVSGLAR